MDEFPQHGPPDPHPVFLAVSHRITAVLESRTVEQIDGEKVRVEPEFLDQLTRHVGDAAHFAAVDAGADDSVESDLPELRLIGLRADPVVAVKEHRFFARGMNLPDALLRPLDHELVDEFDPIEIRALRHAVGRAEVAVVHDVVGTQPIPLLRFELVERLR